MKMVDILIYQIRHPQYVARKIFVPRFAKQNINSRRTSILVFEVGNATRPCYLPDTSKPADKDSSAETEQEWDV